MNWYIGVLKNYVGFTGRAGRKEFWMFLLFHFIALVALSLLDDLLGLSNDELGWGLISGIYVLATFLPALAVTVRRLHDTGRSGWWYLISLIPIIGGIVLLVFLAMSGDPNDNAYGPTPN